MKRLLLKNFRIVDKDADFFGSLLLEGDLIAQVLPGGTTGEAFPAADLVIDGSAFAPSAALMPAFVDLHAHVRDVYPPETAEAFPAETIESAALAAAAGGFVTVFCMANTKPPVDTIEKAFAIKSRADALGVIDLYPVLSLTKNMEGIELSEICSLPALAAVGGNAARLPLLLSEDGKDLASDELFRAAMAAARRLGVPVSCHCDFGGAEAEAAKQAGKPRAEWSRIEENNAVRRAIELGKQAGCHIHIAHVSTAEAAAFIREAKKTIPPGSPFKLTCEATPHHIGATDDDARRMGQESFGRVNPPLRSETDRQAIIAALFDGTIDAIATDHAPHSASGKAAGAPGFTGLETAFSVCLSCISHNAENSTKNNVEKTNSAVLRQLSALMSANPAKIAALDTRLPGRGKIAPGLRGDIVIVDTNARWKPAPEKLKSRGRCSPFADRELRGKVLLTINSGRIVYEEM